MTDLKHNSTKGSFEVVWKSVKYTLAEDISTFAWEQISPSAP